MSAIASPSPHSSGCRSRLLRIAECQALHTHILGGKRTCDGRSRVEEKSHVRGKNVSPPARALHRNRAKIRSFRPFETLVHRCTAAQLFLRKLKKSYHLSKGQNATALFGGKPWSRRLVQYLAESSVHTNINMYHVGTRRSFVLPNVLLLSSHYYYYYFICPPTIAGDFLPIIVSVACPTGPHPPLRLARRPNRGHIVGGAWTPS